MRYDPSDYLYASARIRAMEGRLIGRDQLNQLLEISTPEALLRALAEKGFDPSKGEQKAAEEMLKEAYAAVAESIPDPRLILFLQYPYDCHNQKVLEKCRITGEDPTPLLMDLGSVSVENLLTVAKNADISPLPTHLAKAVTQCRAAFAATADPREIDFILDRALWADMAAAAAPFPFAAEWVRTKAELINLSMCRRLLLLGQGPLGRATLERAILPVGHWDTTRLLSCYDGGLEAFEQAISRTPYAPVFGSDLPAFAIERRMDDHLMSLAQQAKGVTFGAEVPVAYLLAVENQVKNIRILLAGKRAGIGADVLRERIRCCYV